MTDTTPEQRAAGLSAFDAKTAELERVMYSSMSLYTIMQTQVDVALRRQVVRPILAALACGEHNIPPVVVRP